MDFRTRVALPEPLFHLSPADETLFAGSCFAENVGRFLADSRFRCKVNPFGVLYNPVSIAAVLYLSVCEEKPAEHDFFEAGGHWHSWLNDSSFDAGSLADCRDGLETVLEEVRNGWRKRKALFLTLGTNRLYVHKETGRAVGNCHKQPARLFEERVLTVEETVRVLGDALTAIWQVAPQLKVVFTVSPYRYAKYGFHESQLGKSVLLLAVDALCREYPERCMYFPAYELLLDELRDYRFYADDMLHPSVLAVRYIRECFSQVFFTEEARMFQKDWETVTRALAHRPLHPGSEEHRTFVLRTMEKLDLLKKKYPGTVVSDEMRQLSAML